ncbi:hypothetical protein [Thiocystis violacea]|uniref:hypothetical protein n=1 Tax=Thiocystis violacea TaxID=13725 RepID=UPI0019054CDD|nr:hypothetical protein [Thiocystis violacea]
MAYGIDLSASARRHLEAAHVLYDDEKRRDVAGYVYGIAAECAVKAMMREAGMQPLTKDKRREDPFYAHFPELKTLLRDLPLGRRGTTLMKFIENPNFMSQWDTDMRYCKGDDINRNWVDRWRNQAKDVVGAIGT